MLATVETAARHSNYVWDAEITSCACQLHDVPQNGVAFECTQGPLAVGDTLPLLALRFGRYDAYRGAVRVSSVRELAGKRLVGAVFLGAPANIGDVLQLREVENWRSYAGHGLALKDQPWRVSGHERFQSLIADFRLLFRDAEPRLGDLEMPNDYRALRCMFVMVILLNVALSLPSSWFSTTRSSPGSRGRARHRSGQRGQRCHVLRRTREA